MMEALRSWWEIPSIAHFCSLFRAAFDLPDFDIEELEEGLLAASKDEGSVFLQDLFCRLLRGCYAQNDIEPHNYELYLKDVISQRWEYEENRANPLNDTEFRLLTLRQKVEILQAVCDYRLDADDVMEKLKGFDGDNMRIEPLAKDSTGATYWYFYGSRLYKEDPEPPKEQPQKKKEKDKKKTKKKEKNKKEKDKKHSRKKKEKSHKKETKAAPVQQRSSRGRVIKQRQIDTDGEDESEGSRRSGRSTRDRSKKRQSAAFERYDDDDDSRDTISTVSSIQSTKKRGRSSRLSLTLDRNFNCDEDDDSRSYDEQPKRKRGRTSRSGAVEMNGDEEELQERKSLRPRRTRSVIKQDLKDELSEDDDDDDDEDGDTDDTGKGEADEAAENKRVQPQLSVNNSFTESDDDEDEDETLGSLKEKMKQKTPNTASEKNDEDVEHETENGEVKSEKDENETDIKTENSNDIETKENCNEDESKDEIKTEIKVEKDSDKMETDDGDEKEKDEKEIKEETNELSETKDEMKNEEETEEDLEQLMNNMEKQKDKEKIAELEQGIVIGEDNSDGRWHLLCVTMEDWENLAEKFKNSTVRCEKDLYKCIILDFLPAIPGIIEAREKEKKKRELENAPRRSNRITLKKQEQEEQERILAEALLEEEKQKQEEEEARRLQREQERLEEEKKAREERQKLREERAKRLEMREQRARLIAEGKEIPPELLYTASPFHSKYEESDRPELDDDTIDGMIKVIEAVREHKDAWPFYDPVDEEVAPGYHDVIKRPMDLSTIDKKLHNRDYRSVKAFISDFNLMFNNCRKFNGLESELGMMTQKLQRCLNKAVKLYLENDDDDYRDEDEDFRMSVQTTEKKMFRPRRAASSRAMDTLQKAMDDDEFERYASLSPPSIDELEQNPDMPQRKKQEMPRKRLIPELSSNTRGDSSMPIAVVKREPAKMVIDGNVVQFNGKKFLYNCKMKPKQYPPYETKEVKPDLNIDSNDLIHMPAKTTVRSGIIQYPAAVTRGPDELPFKAKMYTLNGKTLFSTYKQQGLQKWEESLKPKSKTDTTGPSQSGLTQTKVMHPKGVPIQINTSQGAGQINSARLVAGHGQSGGTVKIASPNPTGTTSQGKTTLQMSGHSIVQKDGQIFIKDSTGKIITQGKPISVQTGTGTRVIKILTTTQPIQQTIGQQNVVKQVVAQQNATPQSGTQQAIKVAGGMMMLPGQQVISPNTTRVVYKGAIQGQSSEGQVILNTLQSSQTSKPPAISPAIKTIGSPPAGLTLLSGQNIGTGVLRNIVPSPVKKPSIITSDSGASLLVKSDLQSNIESQTRTSLLVNQSGSGNLKTVTSEMSIPQAGANVVSQNSQLNVISQSAMDPSSIEQSTVTLAPNNSCILRQTTNSGNISESSAIKAVPTSTPGISAIFVKNQTFTVQKNDQSTTNLTSSGGSAITQSKPTTNLTSSGGSATTQSIPTQHLEQQIGSTVLSNDNLSQVSVISKNNVCESDTKTIQPKVLSAEDQFDLLMRGQSSSSSSPVKRKSDGSQEISAISVTSPPKVLKFNNKKEGGEKSTCVQSSPNKSDKIGLFSTLMENSQNVISVGKQAPSFAETNNDQNTSTHVSIVKSSGSELANSSDSSTLSSFQKLSPSSQTVNKQNVKCTYSPNQDIPNKSSAKQVQVSPSKGNLFDNFATILKPSDSENQLQTSLVSCVDQNSISNLLSSSSSNQVPSNHQPRLSQGLMDKVSAFAANLQSGSLANRFHINMNSQSAMSDPSNQHVLLDHLGQIVVPSSMLTMQLEQQPLSGISDEQLNASINFDSAQFVNDTVQYINDPTLMVSKTSNNEKEEEKR